MSTPADSGPAASTGKGKGPGPGLPWAAVLGVAFMEGAAVMVVELAAARIMAPYFGQSVFVWTNVIGIILAAVALGNFTGGWWADRAPSLFPMFALLVLSGLCCLAVPFLVRPLSSLFIAPGLHLEEAFLLLARGSFVAAMVLFAPPVFFAGAALPFLVKAAAGLRGRVGRASGAVYGSSTLGSITGTFLTTYWMVETLGSKGTLFAVGLGVTAVAGVAYLLLRKRFITAGLLMAGAAGLVILGAAPPRTIRPGPGLVDERESRYQYVRVRRDPGPKGALYLEVDEGFDSFQSLYVPGQVLTGGQYYDYLTLLPVLAGMTGPRTVCILGLAGGTSARQYDRFFGDRSGFHMDGIEIDPVTVEMGRRYLGLQEVPERHLTVYTGVDGRCFLHTSRKAYDVIIVDAYARQLYIPFQLATREFFHEVRDHLTPRGIFGMNVGGFFHEDALLEAVTRTAASVFGSVSVSRIPRGRNFMIFARREGGAVDPRSARLPRGLESLAPLLKDLAHYGVTRRVEAKPGFPVLTDDHAPVAALCSRDLQAIGRRLFEEE